MIRTFAPYLSCSFAAALLLTIILPNLPTRLAAFGRVSKSLLMEELLLASRPEKLISAFNTGALLIFKLKAAHIIPPGFYLFLPDRLLSHLPLAAPAPGL